MSECVSRVSLILDAFDDAYINGKFVTVAQRFVDSFNIIKDDFMVHPNYENNLSWRVFDDTPVISRSCSCAQRWVSGSASTEGVLSLSQSHGTLDRPEPNIATILTGWAQRPVPPP